jgi:Family of unknown function (DUF5681)
MATEIEPGGWTVQPAAFSELTEGMQMTERKKLPPHAWKKGQSGNPAGKPAGARNKATQMVMSLIEGAAKEVATAIIDAAKKGDLAAAKMVLERLAPPVRERAITLKLPETKSIAGIDAAQRTILAAVAKGQLLPAEGTALAGIVDARRRAFDSVEMERRITELERNHGKK